MWYIRHRTLQAKEELYVCSVGYCAGTQVAAPRLTRAERCITIPQSGDTVQRLWPESVVALPASIHVYQHSNVLLYCPSVTVL